MQGYTKALGTTKETIKEMLALEASLTGLANVGMTVPKDGAVVVPHGSTVVSHEDVNVDVDSDEVRAVDKNEVRDGYGNDNPKTKRVFDCGHSGRGAHIKRGLILAKLPPR